MITYNNGIKLAISLSRLAVISAAYRPIPFSNLEPVFFPPQTG